MNWLLLLVIVSTTLSASDVTAQNSLVWGQGSWGAASWSSKDAGSDADVSSNSYWQLSSNSFSGTITNGVLSAGGQISLTVKNVSSSPISIVQVTIFSVSRDNVESQIGSTADPELLGGDGQLDSNEAFGLTLTLSSFAYPFPFKWVIEFTDPRDEKTKELVTYLALTERFASGGVAIISAVGSTGGAVMIDSDLDGIQDSDDPYPFDPARSEENDSQSDDDSTDNAASDLDTDGDGYPDEYEVMLGSDPNNGGDIPTERSQILRLLVLPDN
jgi:hypothetical protein